MHIVEYLDEKTHNPTGVYAKRTKDPDTGIESDEIIPKKVFIVTDFTGKILTASAINYSRAIEVDGKSHCFELDTGQECHLIADADLPPASPGQVLTQVIVDTYKYNKALGKLELK